MATVIGQHVEYVPQAGDEPAKILRVFPSEIAALRSAVDNGNRHAFVRFGETIDGAIARERTRIPTSSEQQGLGQTVARSPRAPKPKSETALP